MNNPISNNNSHDDQVIMKSVFNRGVKKGRPETAEDLIGSCKQTIKINVKPLQSKKTVVKKYSKSPSWIKQFYRDRQKQENHF